MKWVLVTGARVYPDLQTVVETMSLALLGETTLVHGDAPGVDRVCKYVAEVLNKPQRVFKYRGELGRAGGVVRNQEMVDFVLSMLILNPNDVAVCHSFPLIPEVPKSGTRDCMRRIKKAGLMLIDHPAQAIGVD